MGSTRKTEEKVISPARTKKAPALKVQVLKTKKVVEKPKTTPKVQKEIVSKPKKVSTKVRKRSVVVDTEEEVIIPEVPSIRLLERLDIYSIWYRDHLHTYMTNTARVVGFVFVLFGISFSAFSYVSEKLVFQEAAIVCSEASCIDIPDVDLPALSPLVTFLNSMPENMTADTDLIVKVERGAKFKVVLMDIKNGGQLVLDPEEQVSENQYRYLVRAKELDPSTYKLVAEVDELTTQYKFNGPTFIIPEVEPAEIEFSVDPIEPASDETSDTLDGLNQATTSMPDMSEERAESLASTTRTTESSVSAVDNPLSIKLVVQESTAFVTITTGSFLPETVDLYTKLTPASERIFLGQATQVEDEWVFSLSALDLPQLTHQIFASFKIQEIEYQTEAVSYRPLILEESVSLGVQNDLSILVQKIDLALFDSEAETIDRANYYSLLITDPELYSQNQENTYISSTMQQQVTEVMQSESEIINKLLLNYGMSLQGGHDYLVQLADNEIESFTNSMISRIGQSTETSVSSALETVFSLRFLSLKNRIKENEERIQSNSNNLTQRDTDSDGISDFDEISHTGTNAYSADSDADGVQDAIEVIRGFDANAFDIQNTLMSAEHIENTSSEKMAIEAVVPQVVTLENTSVPVTHTLIHGFSIPQSFVYVVSPSAEIIGIVKTNAEGRFSYTLEKDLEVGSYEILLVLADNNGRPVASSKPYQFSKSDDGTLSLQTHSRLDQTATPPQSLLSSPKMVTAGVGVTAFGLILLLLGESMRQRKDRVVVKTV
jgi:hypothetical protein